jgi:nicotinate-nucleotide adenylyltransferase
MRIGVFGGSFDPVHFGHLLLAEMCREQYALDEVWFVPAAVAPHKPQHAVAGAAERFEMLQLATGGHEAFRVSRLEIDRGGTSYTVDTLAQIHAQYPDAALFLIMGSDSLADLVNWRDPAGICQLATPLVVHRAGTAAPDFGPLRRLLGSQRFAAVGEHIVAMPAVELSSREIRRRIAAGASVRYQTPRAVEQYIRAHGCYAGASS